MMNKFGVSILFPFLFFLLACPAMGITVCSDYLPIEIDDNYFEKICEKEYPLINANLQTLSTSNLKYLDWAKCYGGSNFEVAESILQTSDGGYAVAGYTKSSDGNISFRHGYDDYWVIKLDSNGIIEWQKCLGGSKIDQANSIIQTSDNGFVVAGYSMSDDGDVSGNHGPSSADCWLVKLNFSGDIEWQKCLGGTYGDMARDIIQTADNGYVVACYTDSYSDDVIGNHGGGDYWVIKLDSKGTIEWQNCLGGSDYDNPESIAQTTDGGYVVTGITLSNDGDVNGYNGGFDFWVVKLDAKGAMEWQKCLGGSSDDCAYSITDTGDGGCAVAGYAKSVDGDVLGNHGEFDFLVIKLDSNGIVDWQKCFGGTSFERAYSISQTEDDGFAIAGLTNSSDGDVNGNHGGVDCWVIKLDSEGSLEWEGCLGGSSSEAIYSIVQTKDNGYAVAGGSSSNDYDVNGNHGGGDFWVVKIKVGGTLRTIANFTANVTSGEYPLVVNFTDISTGDPNTWFWDFGDGNTSTKQNPVHIFDKTGNFTVGLTVSNEYGSDHLNVSEFIQVVIPSNVPDIEWQRCLGGSLDDEAKCVVQTADGGYAVAGHTSSNDYDVSRYDGGGDYWVVKLDSSGNAEWKRCLGGSYGDDAESIIQTIDGGYAVFGSSSSSDGDITRNHGSDDFWIVKLDSFGTIEWDKCFGGTSHDCGECVIQTTDGGYALAGYTKSDNGDVSGNHGYGDFWVVKLNSTGHLSWQNCLGGAMGECAESIIQATDGGYVIAGRTSSDNGDVSENHGGNDYWVVKLDPDGVLEWQNCLGGKYDDWAESVIQTTDGGYAVAGYTSSWSYDIKNHGQYDCWVVKLSPNGELVWQKCFGGTFDDFAESIIQTADGNYVIAGRSASNDGDVSGNYGVQDFWLVKYNETGCIEWDGNFGGSKSDGAYSIIQTIDGGYSVAGYTYSNDCDVSGYHDYKDYWVIKLEPDEDPIVKAEFITNTTSGISPMCVQFNDTSIGDVESWLWDFGDGETSSEQNPMHVYTKDGAYSVSLTVGNNAREDTLTKSGLIIVKFPAPKARLDLKRDFVVSVQNNTFTAGTYDSNLIYRINTTTNDYSSTIGNITYIAAVENLSWVDHEQYANWNESYAKWIFPPEYVIYGGEGLVSQAGTSYYEKNFYNYTFTRTCNVSIFETDSAQRTNVSVVFNDLKFESAFVSFGTINDANLSTKIIPNSFRTNAPIQDFISSEGVCTIRIDASRIIAGNVYFFVIDSKIFPSGFGVIHKPPVTVMECTSNNFTPIGETYIAEIPDSLLPSDSTLISVETNTSCDWIVGRQNNLFSVLEGSSISIPESPVAKFDAYPRVGSLPLNVSFNDLSTGDVDNWLWEFGDGSVSQKQNPVHTYNSSGEYSVTLSINNGEDTLVESKYIRVTSLLLGDANCDGEVNQADTLCVLKKIVGIDTLPDSQTIAFECADVHWNGIIDIGDAMFIAQYNVGLRDAWFMPII